MSARYLGGIVSRDPLTLNPAAGNAANGVFTLNQYMQAVKNATWPGFDPYFNETVLLLHGNGTNGAQNNTFLDSSTNNFTITRNGNTTQGTFSPFSVGAGEWSNFFDGSGDRLTAPANAAFQPGTGDFSLEAFFYSQTTAIASICGTNYTGAGANTYILLGINRDSSGSNVPGVLSALVADAAGNSIFSSSSVFSNNTWNHVVFCRTGSTLSLFINGSRVGSITNTTNITPNIQFEVGDTSALTRPFAGYISNVRFIKGSHPYDATQTTYTVPTAPLTAITNTSLLTCQSNRFVDNGTANSGTGFTITRNGDVRVTPFSPFAPTAAYSAGTNGGSGYFDPTGDYLSISDSSNLASPGSGDFTLAAWIYLPQAISNALGASAFYHLKNDTGTSTTVFIGEISSGGAFNLSTGTALIVAGTAGLVRPGQWNYLVASRVSGTLKTFVNGVEDKSISNSTTYNGSVVQIGAWRYSASDFSINGYISDLRFVKGSGVTSVTVPTAPLTAITNTSLLCNFTNAGIIDNTGKNNLETVGNAQIDTAVKKYGTGSLEFDGTTDYVVQPTSDNYGYGTGDFTIEFWLYMTSVSGSQSVVSNLTSASSTNPHIYINTTIRYYTANADRITGAALNTGQWYHIAVCRGSGSTRLFIDGTQSGSTYADTNNYGATAPLGIGTYWASGSPVTTNTLNGYIDDLRITKGVARYTANFAVPYLPQGPLPLVGGPYIPNTVLMLPGTGTNGAQNNTFLDSSTNNFTITRNGNTTQGTFTPFSRANGYWGNYFDGTGDWLGIAYNAAFLMGTSTNFCMEGWIYPTETPANSDAIYSSYPDTTNNNWIIWFQSGKLGVYQYPAASFTTGAFQSTTTIPINTWTHFAFTRSGSDFRLFINGVQEATLNASVNFGAASKPLEIGRYGNNTTSNFNGYISNLRHVIGSAVYTSNFTPTGPLTNISNTVLLTCQSSRFVDNSTNNFTITRNGDTRVVTFSPFEYLTAYSPATNGGSGYFDGTGDYLTVANNTAFDFSTSDFTIEGWFYQAASATKALFGKRTDATTLPPFLLNVDTAGNLNYLGSFDGSNYAINITGTRTVIFGTWNHIAVTRSGNTYTLWVNGASAGTSTVSGSLVVNTGPFCVASSSGAGTIPYNGYITNFRVVKGTAVYSGTFTPPTLPLSTSGAASASAYPSTTNVNTSFASSATSLLCDFTNAGIYDASMTNDLETVGNAQVSTTQSKWGGGSMYFDGTDDRIFTPSSVDLIMGTGNFTIEGWFYANSISNKGIFQLSSTAGGLDPSAATANIAFALQTNGYTVYAANIGTTITALVPVVNVWTHFAVVRSSGVVQLYINGTQIGSNIADTTNYTGGNLVVGGYYSTVYLFNGYISDLRILKGVAILPTPLQTSQWQDQ